MERAVLGTDGQIRCPKCGSVSLQALGRPARRLKCLSCGEKLEARAEAQQLTNQPPPSLRSFLSRATPPPAAIPPPATAVPHGWPPPQQQPYPQPYQRPPGVQTLRLLRTTRSIGVVRALLTVAPGLTHAQARQLLAASHTAPQPLLVDRTPAEINSAAIRLRNAGVYFDVV